MTVNITWPSAFELEVVDSIRSAIGRPTDWYYVASSIECPDCSLDPITNTSTDSFCTTCSGVYYIPVYEYTQISGHITWGFSEQLGWVSGGQLAEGDCRVQIKYSDETIEIIDKTLWVEVDGKKMEIVKKTLRGVKDINRILCDLKQIEDI